MSTPGPIRRRIGAILAVVAVATLLGPVPATAQEPGWTARLFLQALSVEDADDWWVLRQQVSRRLPDGRRFEVGIAETRRFGVWDVSLEGRGTLRPGDVYLTLDARYTPGAEILEDAHVGARAALPLGELVPSLGYRLQLFADGTVHTVSPRLEWYRGPWLFSGELRLIRSAVETVNLAGIARVTRRLPDGWSVWAGLAGGEEDFLVGQPPDQRLSTLRTRSLLVGFERDLPGGWALRLDLTGVNSDPRLDRIGGGLTVTRTF